MVFEKLGQLGKLTALAKRARDLQKELRETEVEAVSSDGQVRVVLSGDVHIKEIEIAEELLTPERKREVERKLVQVIAEGIARAQAFSAEKAKGIAKELGVQLPGM